MLAYNIQCFLVLAHELNFTRSAEIMNITQPSFSKIISSLEDEVGCKLFLRDRRCVQLSDAGAAFYSHAEKLMREFNEGILQAKQAELGMKGCLRISFLNCCVEELLPELIAMFRARYPKIELSLYDGSQRQAIENLRSNAVDVALVGKQLGLNRLENCCFRTIYQDEYCVLVNKDHPLAERDQVSLTEFESAPFLSVGFNHAYHSVTISDINMIIRACADCGFLPNIIRGANTLTNLPLMVECGLGVAFLAEHMKKYASDNVRFLKLSDHKVYFTTVAAWRADNKSPALKNFLAVLDEYLSTRTGTSTLDSGHAKPTAG